MLRFKTVVVDARTRGRCYDYGREGANRMLWRARTMIKDVLMLEEYAKHQA